MAHRPARSTRSPGPGACDGLGHTLRVDPSEQPAPVAADVCIVIPCYNEVARLDRSAFLDLAARSSVRLLFVDDGSDDTTAAVLADLAAAEDHISVLTLPENSGKAEAVRRGMVEAIAGGADLVGYYDADLATPPDELLRLVAVLAASPELTCVMGSRVALLGTAIERRAVRHYVGRVFASAASVALGITVYDTQCGAKVFRCGPALVAATARPFESGWAFDVELLDRLLTGSDTVAPVPVSGLLEVPLHSWRDVPGSQVRPAGAVRALVSVGRIGAARFRRRGAGQA